MQREWYALYTLGILKMSVPVQYTLIFRITSIFLIFILLGRSPIGVYLTLSLLHI